METVLPAMYMLNTAPILFVYLLLVLSKLLHACRQDEYGINGQCCPMCNPGMRVVGHCTETSSTTCASCVSSTYKDKPNGLTECIQCTVCDAGNQLKIKQACTSTSNTICEPLEGHYCIDPYKDTCRQAWRHSKCLPGQYISQKGTTLTDTVCVDCVNGTYSNGLFTSCKPHTECESKGLSTVRPGTALSDTECGGNQTVLIVVLSIGGTALLLLAPVVYLILKRQRGFEIWIHTEEKESVSTLNGLCLYSYYVTNVFLY